MFACSCCCCCCCCLFLCSVLLSAFVCLMHIYPFSHPFYVFRVSSYDLFVALSMRISQSPFSFLHTRAHSDTL
jgi:hypothetical protein